MLGDKKTTWILVADKAKAKTYKWLPENNFIQEISSLENKDARKHERELKSDRPGHGNNPNARYSVEEKSSFKHQASQNFIKDVAALLNKDQAQSAHDKLVVIAQEEVYQNLLSNLSPIARDKITQHHAKDLTNMPPQSIADYYHKYVM